MSKYTDDLTALYTAKKASDIEKQFKEANRATAERDEQNKKRMEDQEKQDRNREFDQKMRQEDESARQALKDAEELERRGKNEEQYQSTINKLTSEMKEMKILFSLPESERVEYLRRQEEAHKQEVADEEQKRRDVELEDKKEEKKRIRTERQNEKKLADIMDRFKSEGIRSFDRFAQFSTSRKKKNLVYRDDMLGDIFAIAGERIDAEDINPKITPKELDEWMARHREFAIKEAAEIKERGALTQIENEKTIKKNRINTIRRYLAFCVLLFIIYELWHRAF